MIVGIEGLSRSGKTTFINRYLELYPNTLRFRGAGAVNIGMQQRWQDYNYWMHNIIEQLDRLNNYQPVILWDRFMTDAVHSEDELYRSEILRVMKSHAQKAVIWIDTPVKVLKNRNSKEGSELKAHKKRYEQTLQSFQHYTVKPTGPNYWITDDDIHVAHEWILNFKKEHYTK